MQVSRLVVSIACVVLCAWIGLTRGAAAGSESNPAHSPGLEPGAWERIVQQLDEKRPTPSELAKLTVAETKELGSSVAISGNTVVVGDPGNGTAGDDAGAAYVFRRNAGGADAWGLVATLQDGSAGDRFGTAVAIDGEGADTLVVGAPFDDESGVIAGSAHVYQRNAGGADQWGRVSVLTPTDATALDEFGSSVAISGSTIVIGAHRDDLAGSDAGAAYVFERTLPGSADAGTWSQVAVLTAGNAGDGDGFGKAVAVDGPTIVAGAPFENGPELDSGAAYVFERDPTGASPWYQAAKLSKATGAAEDEFGAAVDVHDDTIVVGVHGDDVAAEDAGSAIVFARVVPDTDGEAWLPVAELTASDAAPGDRLARAVSISGDRIVLGAALGGAAGSESGAAYVFERNVDGADQWGQLLKLNASDGAAADFLGASVAISGHTLVAGAAGSNALGGIDAGAAYVFRLDGCDWFDVADFDGPAYSGFGESVSLSGDTLVVGDPDHEYTGIAYVFERNTGGPDNWGLVAQLTAPDATSGFSFGESVSISGGLIVVGAFGDTHAGPRSGSAYVFERNLGGTNAWGQAAKLTAADAAPDTYFGRAVAISGNTIVIGAYTVDSAYVFERSVGGPNAWGQVAKLTGGRLFGYSVAIDGDHLIVGAKWEDDPPLYEGAAYVFRRFQETESGVEVWGQVRILTADDGSPNDQFGISVAISGDKAVVGASQDDGIQGAAYVFSRNAGGLDAWGQMAKLTAQDPTASRFGQYVSLSMEGGDTVAVGTWSGSAYVFGRNAGGPDTWDRIAKLEFGSQKSSVSISGDTIALADTGALGLHVYYWACPQCGDTIIEPPEQCDDGNALGGDGCSADCFSDETCGNDIVDPWEVCDDGDLVDGDGCDSNCTPTGCGNEAVSFPEQCDDGNTVGGDGCSADCLSDETCGNGIVDPWEECDDGNNDDGDRCRGDCLIEGACCEVTVDAAECRVVIEADCLATGGRFLGAETDCTSFHCSCEPIPLMPLTAANPQPGIAGPYVAIGGNTLVARVSDLSYNLEKTGVFDRSATDQDDWTQTATLDTPGGRHVAIDGAGDTVVVGASLDSDAIFQGGAIYVFERDPSTGEWDDGVKLFADDPTERARFGGSVAVDGDLLVAGESGTDSVYVFERTADAWSQVDQLHVEGTGFGKALAIRGEIIAVGDWLDDDQALNAGAVYIFERSVQGDGDGTWTQVAKLYSPVGGLFGASVDLDAHGDLVVIGAYGEGPVYEQGAAYVFGRNVGGSDAWGLVAELRSPEPKVEDYFGISVAIDANGIVVGAVDGESDAIYAGAAYVFTRNSRGPDSWGQVARLAAPDRADGDYFGRFVSISGNTIVIGALGETVIYAGRLECSDCSDGSVGLFEVCDDGNSVDGDGCSATCETGCGTGLNRFTQTVLALDKTTFGWSLEIDAAYVRGDLDFANGYDILESGALTSSTSLTAVPDPIPGSGYFVLFRAACPVSTWSSGGSGECSAASCDRDAQLPPP